MRRLQPAGRTLCLSAACRAVVIPPVEPLTSKCSRKESGDVVQPPPIQSHGQRPTQRFRFAYRDSDRGLLDHGVSPENRSFVAEAEEQYQRSFNALHAIPGGLGEPETHTEVMEDGSESTVMRFTAPFGETMVPSSKERFALRGAIGELKAAVELGKGRRDEDVSFTSTLASLSLKKERQLEELLASPNVVQPQLAIASGLNPLSAMMEKSETCARIICDCISANLSLQSRTVENLFSLWSQTRLLAMSGTIPACTGLPGSQVGDSGETAAITGSGTGGELQPWPMSSGRLLFLEEMKSLYLYMRQRFTSPTPLIMEILMLSLSLVSQQDRDTFHLANRLMLDADQFVVLPSRTTYAAYFDVCRVNRAMTFAVQRFKDAITKLSIEPDSAMVAALLKGLNQNGLVEEAVALLARTERIPMDVELFNATLEALLMSQQPLSCFAAFNSAMKLPSPPTANRRLTVRSSAVVAPFVPNAETYTLLLLACEKSGQWERTTEILADMQQRRVKGNAETLNLMLKGLLLQRLDAYAQQLHRAMAAKSIPVWPALEDVLQKRRLITRAPLKDPRGSVTAKRPSQARRTPSTVTP